jgi:hypothetical protein
VSVEGLKPDIATAGTVWVVLPATDGYVGVRVFASWAALHDEFPRSPKIPRGHVEGWFEFSWAEPGDAVSFTAVHRDIRI